MRKLFAHTHKLDDIALLVLRVAGGIVFAAAHGWPKLTGGTEKWAKVGGAMSTFGIDFAPVFWGFMATFSEFFGALLLVIGLVTRPASFLLVVTMVVAATMHLAQGDGFITASNAIFSGVVFLTLLISGAGRYSIDARF